jgi:hypothetical protein
MFNNPRYFRERAKVRRKHPSGHNATANYYEKLINETQVIEYFGSVVALPAMNEQEIWALAVQMEKELLRKVLGPASVIVAELLSRGDDTSVANWNAIAAKVEQLRHAQRA